MKTLPLFGSGVRSYSDVVTRQRRVNCIYDIREDQDQSSVILVGTPGSFSWITLPTSPVYGWHVVGTTLYVVSGTRLYSVLPGGSYTDLGSLPTVSQYVDMDDNGVQLLIVDGVRGYTFTFLTSVLAAVTDVNFPDNTTSVAFLNGYFYVGKPGTREFQRSGLLDGTLWTPYVSGFKENSSDLLLELMTVNGVLVLFGQLQTEFWQDIGASPLPVQRITGATQTWGLAASHSHTLVGNTAMFLGVDPDGGTQVMKLNGYTPVPVSTSDITSIIDKMTTKSDAVALTYSVLGHSIYQLTFPSENRTLCFDLKTSIWHEAQTGLALEARHYAALGVAFNGKNYISDYATGEIYQLDLDTYQDNGQPILRQVCTRHVRYDGNEVHLAQLLLELEVAVANSVVPNPSVSIRVSRDGGSTFGVQRTKPLGAVGEYLTRVVFNRLGYGRDIVVMIEVTDPVKFVLCSGSAVMEIAND